MKFQHASADPAQKARRISAFFPCYNDKHTISDIVLTADNTLSKLTADYEIIVVNDGSTDGSSKVLEDLTQSVPLLRVITHAKNRGYGGALKSGFGAATGDLVFYTDGDGQYDPSELELLLDALTDEVDVVNGYKTTRSDSITRKILGAAYNYVATTMLRIPMRDLDCDFRLFRGHIARQLQITKQGGIVCAQMMQQVHQSGCRIVEIPVTHKPRPYGKSQFFQLNNVLSLAVDLICLWWISLSAKPIPISGYELTARNGPDAQSSKVMGDADAPPK
jgi:glycosyltransferase involved in cell wall biosynthesis